MSGDMAAGSTTLPRTPSSLLPSPTHLTPLTPRPAMAAPMRTPNRACDEDDGRPSSQVSRFQTMPPTRPARTMSSSAEPPSVSSSGLGAPLLVWMLMTALVTVSATSTEGKAPTRLRTADSATASFGAVRRWRWRWPWRSRVMEAVGEVEGERHHDDEREGDGCGGHPVESSDPTGGPTGS
jgi:hypothetical protein